MQFITLLASAAIAATAPLAAAESSADTSLPEDYSWSVENWEAGCERQGCYYYFNVTGVNDNIYPGFKADCSGWDTGYYIDCQILEDVSTSGVPFVAASLEPNSDNGIAAMSVSLSFTDADSQATYNISGGYNATYNAFVAPLQNFNITGPYEEFAVL